MSKHRKKSGGGQDPGNRVPLGEPLGERLGCGPGGFGFARELPPEVAAALGRLFGPPPTFADVVAGVRSGLWHRAVAAGQGDGVVVIVGDPGDIVRVPEVRDAVMLVCHDGESGERTRLLFDREAARRLVNALTEAIAHSEWADAAAETAVVRTKGDPR